MMKRQIKIATKVILSSFALCLANWAWAIPDQPGTLDATWAPTSPLGPGKLITPLGIDVNDTLRAMAVQPDGKVLLAGACVNNGMYQAFCSVRYLPTGAIDSTWGNAGTLLTAVGSSVAHAYAMTVQPDGKVLLAGDCLNGTTSNFCSVRYTSTGVLDTTWGTTGKLITSVSSSSSATSAARAMAVQPDGKVLLAGDCWNGLANDFCSVRYSPTGVLDTTWGTLGKLITSFGSVNSYVDRHAIAVQPDGKVLLAGSCSSGGKITFCSVRYLSTGVPDPTWGAMGIPLMTPIGNSADYPNAIAVQPDGKVLLAGNCLIGATNDFCSVRYLSTGAADPTWGTAGQLTTSIGSNDDFAYAVAVQPDGKVLLAGRCLNASSAYDFCSARYSPSGVLDSTWGVAGKLVTSISISSSLSGNAMAVQADGKVLLADHCTNGVSYGFCVVRYDGGPFGYQNCKLDIDGDGSVLATTDILISARIALGVTGPAAINGITFASNATRNTWPLIRDYLVRNCNMVLP